mmetsp:Transcript_23294/g.66757  ORF Transcript_23294/g.66757 Transcript_23294/m.66757 type:complete len:211 (+) Transcript_23294:961-1593(+)
MPSACSRPISSLARSCRPLHSCQHDSHKHRWLQGKNVTTAAALRQETQLQEVRVSFTRLAACCLWRRAVSCLVACLASSRRWVLAVAISCMKAAMAAGVAEMREESRWAVNPSSALLCRTYRWCSRSLSSTSSVAHSDCRSDMRRSSSSISLVVHLVACRTCSSVGAPRSRPETISSADGGAGEGAMPLQGGDDTPTPPFCPPAVPCCCW